MKRNPPSHIIENGKFSRVEYKGYKYMKCPGGWQFWSLFEGFGANGKGGWVNLLGVDLSKELDREFAAMVRKEKLAVDSRA